MEDAKTMRLILEAYRDTANEVDRIMSELDLQKGIAENNEIGVSNLSKALHEKNEENRRLNMSIDALRSQNKALKDLNAKATQHRDDLNAKITKARKALGSFTGRGVPVKADDLAEIIIEVSRALADTKPEADE